MEFECPEFLKEMSAEQIHERMMANLPGDIDDMPGGFAYDYTMPTALVASELVNYTLMKALMTAFPEYAWGKWLDLHANQAHITRRPANRASGEVTVTGKEGTAIPKGTMFCTAATETSAGIEFLSDRDAVIDESGTVVIPVTARLAGSLSNVMAGTIVLMGKSIPGITKVTNEGAISGGTEEESDESLYERIRLENASENYSYIGNDTDYIRWSKEVAGVGDCIVMQAWNGPGTVKLILVDQNGEPANKAITDAVYEHIVSEKDRSRRLLPSGCAELTVTGASTKKISYLCTGIVFDREKTTLEQIKADFQEAVSAIYEEAKEQGVLVYNKVRGLVISISGVTDFERFQMNGGEENIVLSREEYARTESVEFLEAAGA